VPTVEQEQQVLPVQLVPLVAPVLRVLLELMEVQAPLVLLVQLVLQVPLEGLEPLGPLVRLVAPVPLDQQVLPAHQVPRELREPLVCKDLAAALALLDFKGPPVLQVPLDHLGPSEPQESVCLDLRDPLVPLAVAEPGTA